MLLSVFIFFVHFCIFIFTKEHERNEDEKENFFGYFLYKESRNVLPFFSKKVGEINKSFLAKPR